MDEVVEKVREFVEEECKKPGAKYDSEVIKHHMEPVVNYSRILSEKRSVDKEVVEIAAWLHDIGSIIYGRENHHVTGSEIAEDFLIKAGYDPNKIELIKKCILNHRGSQENNRKSVEEQIIAEADSMAHFDALSGLFRACYLFENKTGQGEAQDSVRVKLINSYNKLSEEAKKIVRPKYEAAMLLLGDRIVKEDKKSHYIVATGIVIKDGKYLITKRAEWEKAFPGKWTVPGGKLEVKDYIDEKKDTSEHWYNILEKLLKREVREETGLEIKDIKYLTSMTFIRPDEIPVLVISLYADSFEGDVKLSNDMIDYKWVSLEEAKNYDLIEGIYEELEMLDKLLKGERVEEWKKVNEVEKNVGQLLSPSLVQISPSALRTTYSPSLETSSLPALAICGGKRENCVFCENPNLKIIRESKNTLAILSNPGLVKGHCLVIPKNHYENILEMPEDVLLEIIRELKEVKKVLLEKLKVSGVDIRQNYRPFLKESELKVDHVHFHLIPREFEDELYKKAMRFEGEVFKNRAEEELDELKEVLSKNE